MFTWVYSTYLISCTHMIPKGILEKYYVREGKSMQEIAKLQKCSLHKVAYWMIFYQIARRSKGDAAYLKNNPNGDPFKFRPPRGIQNAKMFGYGLGLYAGEGTKADKTSVRLGNTNPAIILNFMHFLEEIFRVQRKDFRLGLQLFTDIKEDIALDFWCKYLKVKRAQFYKTTFTRSGSIGTYRKKSEFGVVTLYYHNKRLRDMLCGFVENFR